jgi:hypothetical protein
MPEALMPEEQRLPVKCSATIIIGMINQAAS